MFETNQSIMLMGAAETVDVSTHLANASKKSESECADSSKIDSVNNISSNMIKNFLLINLDVFGDRFKEFREYLLY